jgi:hypothetical protein
MGLITHNHQDHDNLIETVVRMSRESSVAGSVWIVRPMSRASFWGYAAKPKGKNDSRATTPRKDWESFVTKIFRA